MNAKRLKQLVFMGGVIGITCIAMAYSGRQPAPPVAVPGTGGGGNGIVHLSGNLIQKKIAVGGDGVVSLALDLWADDGNAIAGEVPEKQNVDMVIVLDRSGSMSGKKIRDAKNATLRLLEDLTPRDRFALVAYSNTAAVYSGLIPVTVQSTEYLKNAIRRIPASGGTNLGQGLQEGIQILSARSQTGNPGRLILISDGLANHGIKSPAALGDMAAIATEKGFSISTVGVGYDFNERLMTTIADRGAGTYHFLEDPGAFAFIFKKELHRTRGIAAASVTVRVPEKDGLRLIRAGGYPIDHENGHAVFYPGDLHYGERRRFYLDLKVPVHREAVLEIAGIEVQYRHRRQTHGATLPAPFRLACVDDPAEAVGSIEKDIWSGKVLTEDFNRLREDVAGDIRAGRPNEAIKKIEDYRTRQQAINAQVKSPAVARNLESGLKDLEETVAGTFSGDAAEIREKQKKNSKALQYKGYRERRMKN